MSKPPDDIRQWIQELISRSASDQIHNLQRFEDMLRRSSRGEIDQRKLQEEYLRFAREESMRYINDLTRVGLGFYNTLLELNRHYNDRFFSQVLQERQDHSEAPSSNGSSPRVIEMELHAPSGSEATRSFIIENKRAEAVSVSFLVSEFSRENSVESFRPPLQLNPPRFIMQPGEEHVVAVVVPLLPEFFSSGQVYTATVVVSGFEGLQLHLSIWVDPVQESAIKLQPLQGQSDRFEPLFQQTRSEPPVSLPDDLTRLQGIGPAYQRRLQEGGIQSYASLAKADDQTLERLLGSTVAGKVRQEKWQEQAHLAAVGDWSALQVLQDSL